MIQDVCEDHPPAATHTSEGASAPAPPAPIVAGIPERLRALPRWVAWKYENRDGKPTKVPYNARTLQKAASDDTRTWCAFEEAHTAFERGGFAGIGFVLGDGFVGIDLDKCRNPTTGEIESGAAEIIRDIHSYTEVSPSATGVHIIAEGKLPPGRRRAGNVEMYDSGRYFTITGNVVGDLRSVEERQSEIEAVHARIFGRHETLFRDAAPRPNRAKSEPPACGSFALDPNANPPFDKFEALRINVPRFARSWEQKRPDMKDHSQSAFDQSLANFAAMAAWTDQEIADLIVANRRMFGADLKLREDYYRRTIAQRGSLLNPWS